MRTMFIEWKVSPLCGLQLRSFDLWREYAWTFEDMNVPHRGWGGMGCEGASTYFKTWLFVLVKAHCDSSTTGDLSWMQLSSETGALSSCIPLWWPQGLWESCIAQDVQSTQDLLEPSQLAFFLLYSSPSVLVSVSFLPCPLAPPKTTGALHCCQEKERPRLFHCLSLSFSCTWINMDKAELLY